VCATRDARLDPLGVREDGGAVLCVVVGFFGAAGVAELVCAVLDPEGFAAGVAVDCDPPDCATPDQPAISNPNRRIKLPEPRLLVGNGEEKPDIVPLYADLLSTGAAGEPVA